MPQQASAAAPAISPLHSRSRSSLFDSDRFIMTDHDSVDRTKLAKFTMARIRPQIYFLVVWTLVCFKICKDSVLRMDRDQRSAAFSEAFLYYNPLFMMAMMLWLWGVNLWGFAHFRVNYAKIFDLEPGHLTHRDIWKAASWITAIVTTSCTAFLNFYSWNKLNLAATQPVYTRNFSQVLLLVVLTFSFFASFPKVIIYSALPIVLALPFEVFHAPSRSFFLNTLLRLSLPLQAITFADFFLADVLTSMSKVLSDVERSVCSMLYHPMHELCGNHSVWIPVILALPYFFRFCQCLRQYSDTKDRSCLFNALKYATSFPVVFISALKYYVLIESWEGFYRPLWLLSSFLNSLYSFYWDISRDWDLSLFSMNLKPKHSGLRPVLLYSPQWAYYWAIGSNFFLRLAWTYKLSAHLRHNQLTVFAFSGLEMLRRFQWIFFRVENEHNRMLAGSVPDKEAEMSLMSGDHHV